MLFELARGADAVVTLDDAVLGGVCGAASGHVPQGTRNHSVRHADHRPVRLHAAGAVFVYPVCLSAGHLRAAAGGGACGPQGRTVNSCMLCERRIPI